MFGLPLSTTIIAFGIPVLIAAALVWWGMRDYPEDKDSHGASEDSNL